MSAVYLVNPSKRRRRRKKSKRSARRNPSAHRVAHVVKRRRRRRARASFGRVRRYRRNPSGSSLFRGIVNGTLVPAVMGGLGAVGVNVVLGLIPATVMPSFVQNDTTGLVKPAIKLVAALGLGYACRKFISRDVGNAVMLGGATVVVAQTAQSFAQRLMPTLQLAGIDDYPMIPYHNTNMGALIDVPSTRMGELDFEADDEDTDLGAVFPLNGFEETGFDTDY